MWAGDRVQQAWAMLQAGVITQEEFAKLKGNALRFADEQVPLAGSPAKHFVAACAGAVVDTVKAQLGPLFAGLSPKKRAREDGAREDGAGSPAEETIIPPSIAGTTPVKSVKKAKAVDLAGQRSVLAFSGFSKSRVAKDGSLVVQKSGTVHDIPRDIREKKATYPCRWCSKAFKHGPARAAHEKTHEGASNNYIKLVSGCA